MKIVRGNENKVLSQLIVESFKDHGPLSAYEEAHVSFKGHHIDINLVDTKEDIYGIFLYYDIVIDGKQLSYKPGYDLGQDIEICLAATILNELGLLGIEPLYSYEVNAADFNDILLW